MIFTITILILTWFDKAMDEDIPKLRYKVTIPFAIICDITILYEIFIK